MNLKPFKTIDLSYISLELYENYVISTIQEGVLFDLPYLNVVMEIYEKYYGTKQFVLIAQRIYDYTINPTCYIVAPKKLNLLGIAVVCKSNSAFETALFEKKFYNNPYEPFQTLKAAVEWAEKLLEENKKAGL
ncbi:hypothetical protein [Marixanthomonas spongiae]